MSSASAPDPALLRRLLRARDRLSAAPQEDWPMVRLARVSGTSTAHFARAFKAAFGVPPHRYLLTLRLERATALLRGSELPIAEVASACGWRSLGTFGRTFRDVLGQSPSAYRSGGQPGPQPEAQVPVCVWQAGSRPDLKIAVLEKRRREQSE